MAEVEYVVMTAGSFDSAAKWSARATTTCSGSCRSGSVMRAGVQSTESFVYLKLGKQTYSWGVR